MGAPTRSPRSPRWGCPLRLRAFAFPRPLFRFPWPDWSTSAPAFASATGSRTCALLCLARPPALPARWAVGKATHTSATFRSRPNMMFAPSYGCSNSLVEPGAAGRPGRSAPPPLDVAGRRPAGCCLTWCSAAVTPVAARCYPSSPPYQRGVRAAVATTYQGTLRDGNYQNIPLGMAFMHCTRPFRPSLLWHGRFSVEYPWGFTATKGGCIASP